jgi:hypothetical protein
MALLAFVIATLGTWAWLNRKWIIVIMKNTK